MIQSLRTRQFRNLRDPSIDFDGRWTLLVGDNGAGKTSILEAVYLAATSKSFLSHKLIDCCQDRGETFIVDIESEQEGRHHMRLMWDRETGMERTMNGSQVDLPGYLEVQPVVAYTAREAELLDGPPAGRRRFLDGHLVSCDPASIRLLARLRTVVASKKAALVREQPVQPWNELLATVASELQQQRRQIVEELQDRVSSLVSQLGLGERKPQLAYIPSTPEGDGDLATETLLDGFGRRLTEEKACQYPLWGPQRDDWRWTWGREGNRSEIRRRASRGEKKALTIALFVACCQRLIDHRREATLLVDDLDAELDAKRRLQVCELVAELPQVIATSSRPSEWRKASERATHEVKDGEVREG